MVNWVVYDVINMNIGMVPMGVLGILSERRMGMKIERNYETGEVIFNGTRFNVNNLPENTKLLCLVYGFIRKCQDPYGSEKDPAKHDKLVLELAESLMKGVLPTGTSGQSSIMNDAVKRMRDKGMDEDSIAIVIQAMSAAIEARKIKAKAKSKK